MKAPSTVFYTRFQTAVLTSQPPWPLVFRSPSQRSQGSKSHLKTALIVDNSSSMEPEAPFLGFLLIVTNSLLHRWREKCNLFPAQHLKQSTSVTLSHSWLFQQPLSNGVPQPVSLWHSSIHQWLVASEQGRDWQSIEEEPTQPSLPDNPQ